MKPDQTLGWMHDGTRKLLGDVAALPDAALDGPTALPGWSRRYLLSHVAANAGALRNLVHWARTGEERRMYSSTEQREADIAKGSLLPAAELRAWVDSSAQALAADLDTLPASARCGPNGSARSRPGRPTARPPAAWSCRRSPPT